jgi:hypothetical protein
MSGCSEAAFAGERNQALVEDILHFSVDKKGDNAVVQRQGHHIAYKETTESKRKRNGKERRVSEKNNTTRKHKSRRIED